MRFIDKSCYLEKEKILIIADLHLGYEQGLQERGVFIPRTQFARTIEDLEKIFKEINKLNKKTGDNDDDNLRVGSVINNKKCRVKNKNDEKYEKLVNEKLIDKINNDLRAGSIINNKEKVNNKNNVNKHNYELINKKHKKFGSELIINKISKNINGSEVGEQEEPTKGGKLKEIIILGDLKHEFSGNLGQEWREVLNLLEYLKNKAEKITIIRGNHDNYLINVIKNKENVRLVDYYIKDDKAFIHGNKIFPEILDKKIKQIFLGHLHPSISIAKNVKKEIYKCFLVGKYKDKEIIILPSFFPLVEGQDLQIEDTNLAFKLDLGGFEVYVVGDKVYDFGKLKGIGKLVD